MWIESVSETKNQREREGERGTETIQTQTLTLIDAHKIVNPCLQPNIAISQAHFKTHKSKTWMRMKISTHTPNSKSIANARNAIRFEKAPNTAWTKKNQIQRKKNINTSHLGVCCLPVLYTRAHTVSLVHVCVRNARLSLSLSLVDEFTLFIALNATQCRCLYQFRFLIQRALCALNWIRKH